jgi:hypothetical protein
MSDLDFVSTHLWIDGFALDFCAGSVNNSFLRLFPIQTLKKSMVSNSDLYQYGHSEINDSSSIEVPILELTVEQLLDRLKILGYTFENANIEFNLARDRMIESLFSDINGDPNFKYPSYPYQEVFETPQKSRTFLKGMTLNQFILASKSIIENKWRRTIVEVDNKRKSIIPYEIKDPMTRFIVCHGFQAMMFSENLYLLRLIINDLRKDFKAHFVFDGIPSGNLDIVRQYYSKMFSVNEHVFNLSLRTLIITEGVTDSKYLQFALDKNFSHLKDLFYFLDFNVKNGSSENVINITMSLISSGIPNCIVALFDNDFEGNRAKEKLLSKVNNQENQNNQVLILSYPEIKTGYNYPVLDNGQLREVNVNGLGCAIELYLDSRCLKDESSNFYPLTQSSQNQYSFRSSIKSRIQKNFDSLICQESNDICLDGLNSILISVFKKVKNRSKG